MDPESPSPAWMLGNDASSPVELPNMPHVPDPKPHSTATVDNFSNGDTQCLLPTESPPSLTLLRSGDRLALQSSINNDNSGRSPSKRRANVHLRLRWCQHLQLQLLRAAAALQLWINENLLNRKRKACYHILDEK